jgi:hypothetical protein
MALITAYKGDNAHNGLSQSIWADFPISDSLKDPTCVNDVFDDFENMPTFNSATAVLSDKYGYISDTGVVINGLATVADADSLTTGYKGAVEFNIDSDNDIAAIQWGGASVFLSDTAGDERKMWFEARVATTTVVTQSLFIGLAERDMTASGDVVFSDGGAIADISCVGFRILEADSDGWDAIHQLNGGGGEVVVLNEAQVGVATTFYKFGMKYVPSGEALDNKILTYYVNGVEVASVTSIAIATFPDAVGLAPLFVMKAHAATLDARMDWWRCAQVR